MPPRPDLKVDASYKPQVHEDEEDALPKPNEGMAAATKLIAQQMLEDRHVKVLHKTLSKCWNRSAGRVQSLSAAIALMEQYGVNLSDSEAAKLSELEEEKQIGALVNLMPQATNEQFQQFFLQLQLLVSTAMRVRKGLEDGQPEKVAAALDDADSTGVSSYILKMAVIQAGSEVTAQMAEYQTWVKDTDNKMARLIRGQEDAMAAQKKLAGLQAELHRGQSEQVAKASQVAMNFISNNTSALKSVCFHGWQQWAKNEAEEHAMERECEERLAETQRELLEYREQQLKNIRGVFNKKGELAKKELQGEVLTMWKDILKKRKEDDALAEKVNLLSEKVAAAQSAQKENTKKVMERMGAASDAGLLQMALTGWIQEHLNEKKEKEKQAVIAEAEERIQEFLKGKSESAKKMLQAAGGGTDTGLLHQALSGWKQVWEDAKKEAELEAALNDKSSELQAFGLRTKAAGSSAMERSKHYSEQMLLMQTFYNWKMDWSMEMTLKGYHAKIEAKRQQLMGVHQMFRSFATQLESGLKGSDSDRSFKRRDLVKSEHSLSLPEIHKPGTPDRGKHKKTDVPQPRAAWS
mmetsp:Transcript_32377/g.58835  ORF Transcript_32377/g.58835 Transcript_32377/m.58835 type:complete len:578 (-) Transcript_32377:119-1852(-)